MVKVVGPVTATTVVEDGMLVPVMVWPAIMPVVLAHTTCVLALRKVAGNVLLPFTVTVFVVTVGAVVRSKEVALLTLATFEPAGIPATPAKMIMPGARPAVLSQVTVTLPLVILTPVRVKEPSDSAEKVWPVPAPVAGMFKVKAVALSTVLTKAPRGMFGPMITIPIANDEVLAQVTDAEPALVTQFVTLKPP